MGLCLPTGPEPIAVTSERLRILCCDDDPSTTTLQRLFIEMQPDMETVGAVHDLARLEDELSGKRPDLLLLDLVMPGGEPLERIGAIRERFSDLRIVVLSGLDDPGLIEQALHSGAAAYVSKSIEMDELIVLLRRVAQGEKLTVRSRRDLPDGASGLARDSR
jgi:DNA-binding NarL/FixJ family response regulator